MNSSTNVASTSVGGRLRMQRLRQKSTADEPTLSRETHVRGVRFGIHVSVLPRPCGVAGEAFSGLCVVALVDRCFGHGCPARAPWPKLYASFRRAAEPSTSFYAPMVGRSSASGGTRRASTLRGRPHAFSYAGDRG